MYFLVILICLTINYIWLKDLDRFSDAWFFQFQAWVDRTTADIDVQSPFNWLLPILIVYGLPLLAVGLLLIIFDGVLVGMLVMLVHIVVLLIAFDRTQPGQLATNFLALWRQGDLTASRNYLQKELATGDSDLQDASSDELVSYFRKQLTYRCFEKMFVVFFWYMVTGPLGVMFCYVTYQLRDSGTCSEVGAAKHSNRVLIRILEWIPMRLLVLSFSLAGNFVKCFRRFREMLWDFSLDTDYAESLHEFAGAALYGMETGEGNDSADNGSVPSKQSQVAADIEALQALLERSQLIWLTVLALITVFGIDSAAALVVM